MWFVCIAYWVYALILLCKTLWSFSIYSSSQFGCLGIFWGCGCYNWDKTRHNFLKCDSGIFDKLQKFSSICNIWRTVITATLPDFLRILCTQKSRNKKKGIPLRDWSACLQFMNLLITGHSEPSISLDVVTKSYRLQDVRIMAQLQEASEYRKKYLYWYSMLLKGLIESQ